MKSNNNSDFYLLDKPRSWTSQDLCTKLKKNFYFKKVGHSGTLDPNATGLMLLATNGYTKLFDYINQNNKTYKATALLGYTSSTLDITNTANYGLEIRNGSNQVTFDPSVRNIRKVNGETFSVNVAAGTSYTQTISGVTPTNDDEIAIIGGYAYSGPAYGASGVIVTRQNGSIKFDNTNSYFAFVATFEVIRL